LKLLLQFLVLASVFSTARLPLGPLPLVLLLCDLPTCAQRLLQSLSTASSGVYSPHPNPTCSISMPTVPSLRLLLADRLILF
jgi:hypothetical protein